MNKRILILFVLLVSIVNACVDPYYPELDKYETLLAVDGMITNESGPYFIRLSYSSNLNTYTNIPIENAEVSIKDDLGNVEFFHEEDKGEYSNNSTDFQGVIGRSYQLSITLNEGKTYISSWEKIADPVELSNIYAEIEYHEVSNNISFPGYQFYIDSHKVSSGTSYLLWRAECTYEYTSDFNIYFYYDGSLHPFRRTDSLRTCWKNENISEFFTHKMINTNSNVTRFPLHFVSTKDRKLSIRYSLLVNQLSVTEAAYNYWSGLQKQEEVQGSLYTVQPYQMRGNITSVNNTNDPVLGFFLAAGVSQKRIFVDRPTGVDFYYGACILTEGNFHEYGRIRFTDPFFYPVYVTQSGGARAIPNFGCADCRESGGKIKKPDFWTETEN